MKDLKQRFTSFTPIPDDEWAVFEKIVEAKTLKKGEYLCRVGESFRRIAFVRKGLVKVYYHTADGTNYIRNFIPEGRLATPYSAILQNVDSDVNIVALENSTVLTFSYDDYQKLYPRHVCWQELARKLAELYFIVRENREYEFQALDAQARYESFRKNFGDIQNRLTQQDIAAYLGINPASLSRMLKKS